MGKLIECGSLLCIFKRSDYAYEIEKHGIILNGSKRKHLFYTVVGKPDTPNLPYLKLNSYCAENTIFEFFILGFY